jgi:hypothetical protein
MRVIGGLSLTGTVAFLVAELAFAGGSFGLPGAARHRLKNLETAVGKGKPDLPETPPNQIAVNVLDFGAKGDGVADDTPSLADAIAAAGENGKVIFPAVSAYYRTTHVLVPLNGQTWEGIGMPTLRNETTNPWYFYRSAISVGTYYTYGSIKNNFSDSRTPFDEKSHAMNAASAGQYEARFTSAGDALDFSVGDLVYARGTTSYSNLDFRMENELNEVLAVDRQSGVIRFKYPLLFDYPQGSSLYRLGGGVVEGTDGRTAKGCKDFTLRDMIVESGKHSQAIHTGGALNFTMSNVTVRGWTALVGNPNRRVRGINQSRYEYYDSGIEFAYGSSENFFDASVEVRNIGMGNPMTTFGPPVLIGSEDMGTKNRFDGAIYENRETTTTSVALLTLYGRAEAVGARVFSTGKFGTGQGMVIGFNFFSSTAVTNSGGLMENCVVKGARRYGIYVSGRDSIVRNCLVDDIPDTGFGMYIRNDSTNARIENTVIGEDPGRRDGTLRYGVENWGTNTLYANVKAHNVGFDDVDASFVETHTGQAKGTSEYDWRKTVIPARYLAYGTRYLARAAGSVPETGKAGKKIVTMRISNGTVSKVLSSSTFEDGQYGDWAIDAALTCLGTDFNAYVVRTGPLGEEISDGKVGVSKTVGDITVWVTIQFLTGSEESTMTLGTWKVQWDSQSPIGPWWPT